MDNTILDLFERSAKLHHGKIAVKDSEYAYTYGQLQKMAMRIASALDTKISGRVERYPIIIFIDKGAKCLAAILGVLYSGNVYVPVDIKTPKDRLSNIIQTLGGSAIALSLASGVDILNSFNLGITAYDFDELLDADIQSKEIIEEKLKKIRKKIVDTDLMYILFTSGSTGNPKGVAITHGSLVDYIKAFIEDVGMGEDDIIGNQAPFYVDMSLKDIYATLTVGATLCVIPVKLFMTPKKVLQYLDDNKVNYIMWVPTAYRIIYQFKALEKIRPAHLRKLIFSGESMPVTVYKYWHDYYPDAEFYQLYGPTEITGACTYYKVDKEYDVSDTIPIGKPFDNTGIVLIDDKGDYIKEKNQEGEICVYGSCLAAGYFNDLKKTRERFVQRPDIQAYTSLMYKTGDLGIWDEEGNLVFKSRKDYQIKHAGRRIELGEIESAIQSVEGIDACCCVHDRRKDAIVLFYSGTVDESGIRSSIKAKLPQYMFPAKMLRYEILPQLSSGKLDRKKMDMVANEGDI